MIINISKFAISESLSKLAPFLTTLYVAKYLSPELFGKYSLVIVLFEIIFILLSFNIQATTRIDYFKETGRSFAEIKQNHIAISLFILAISLIILLFLEPNQMLIVFLLLICAFIRTFSVFILAIFQCSKQVNSYVFTNIIFVLSLAVFTYIFIKLGLSYLSWLYSMLIASIIQLAIVIKIFGVASFKKYIPTKVSIESLKKTFVPAVLFMPQAIGWWLKSGAERIIIADGLGNVALGVYALAMQFTSILFMYITVLNLALVPEIYRLMQIRDFKKMHKYLLVATFSLLIVSSLIAFLGYAVIDGIYSDEFLLAKSYLPLLIIAGLPQAVMMLYINVLYYKSDGKFVAFIILTSFSVQTVLNFLIINIYGIYGVILCSLFINTLGLFAIIKKVMLYKN